MTQILVRVFNKITSEETVVTYHAYKDTEAHYTLIGQVDTEGNLVEGNPNLEARHKGNRNVVDHVVSTGLSELTFEEKMAKKNELIEKYGRPAIQEPDKTEKKKPGPKPKVVANEA